MPQQKRGLGKGLGALIPTVSSTAAVDSGQPYGVSGEGQQGSFGAYFDEIPVGAITPNPRQPRQVFDEDTLEELAASIGAVGLLPPVVGRPGMPGPCAGRLGEGRGARRRRGGRAHEPAARGAQEAKAPRQAEARPQPVAPALKDLADRLSDAFETRVKVELGQRKGKIVVEFASLDDLERIVKTMTPGLVQPRGAQPRSA